MTKKRFSLLLDDDAPTQEQGATMPQTNVTEDKPRLSIMDNEEEKKSEKIPFSRKLNYWLIQNKTPFLHRTYGISINYNNQKSIQYLLEVKCMGYKKGIFTYILSRKRFFKDGKQLEGILEQLAEQSANCLYPLQVSVNEQGQIIGVTNQEDIKKRWEALKPELSKLYAGKPFKRHSATMDKVIDSPERILKSLNNDVVYDILFSKLYFNYSKAFTQPLEKQFKWFSGIQKIRFQGVQTLNKIVKENGRMLINYKGIMKPTSGLTEGATDIEYQLDAKDHTLLRVDGTFKYSTSNSNKTIQFKAIWQQNIDNTEARKIDDKKRKGIYIDPNAETKWYEFWK